MRKTMTLLSLLVLTAISACAQQLDGSWTGRLALGNTGLTLVMNFSRDTTGCLVCTMDSPDQGARGIPTTVESADPSALELHVDALGVVYKASLADGELRGTFTQRGFAFPLVLKRGTVELRRPQEPKAPFPYKTEDVAVTNVADGVTLAGTLTYPVGFEAQASGSVPVVVMVTGSGTQDRDEAIMGHKPFLVLADYLARHGVASLRYDDRSAGQSTGDATTITMQSNARDAKAAVDYVRRTGRFGKVGVLGHSEGGAIAFMLGAQTDADFIVAMAAPALRGDSVLLEQNRAALLHAGLTAGQCEAYLSVLRPFFARVVSGEDWSEQELAQSLSQKMGQPVPTDFAAAFRQPWMKSFLAYDPASAIAQTACPVMAIAGTLDTQVSAATHLGTIRRVLPKREHNVTKAYDGLNHLFQHAQTGLPTEYAQIEETIAEEVLADVAAWIAATAAQ